MIPYTEEEKRIKRYLLGEANEEDRRYIEESLFADEPVNLGLRFEATVYDYAELFRLLESELIADYARGALSATERALFERHFLSTPKRRKQLAVAQALIGHAEAERSAGRLPARASANEAGNSWLRVFIFPRWKIAIYAVVVIGVAVAFWPFPTKPSSVNEAMAELGKAYGGQRPIEARLTDLPYAAYPRTLGAGSGSSDSTVDFLAKDHAKLLLLQEQQAKPTAEVLRALGNFYLLEKDYSKAIELFERALQTASGDARVHCDYGAALMEKAKTLREPSEGGERLKLLASSLEQLDAALKLDPEMLAALFNRALTNECLSNWEQARADWTSYVSKDPLSSWGAEAQTRLKELTDSRRAKAAAKGRMVERFLQAFTSLDKESAWQVLSLGRERTGNSVLAQLLDDYLLAVVQGNNEQAVHQRQLIDFAGEIELQKVGDRFITDLARVYRTIDPKRGEQLRLARQLTKSAKSEFDNNQILRAADIYRQAEMAFADAGSLPEQLLARCWMAHCFVREPEFIQSWSIYRELLPQCEHNNYLWLQSQVFNGMADNRSRQYFSDSLIYGQNSLELAERIGDTAGVVRNLGFFVTMNLQLGDYRASLDSAARAFNLFDEADLLPRQIWPFFAEGAMLFLKLGFSSAALDFQREALRLARQAKWLPIICRSYSRLGLIYNEQDDLSQALDYFHSALEGDCSPSSDAQAYAWLQLGQAYFRQGDFRQALNSFEQAVSKLEQSKNLSELLFAVYHSHKGRAQSLLRLGRNDEGQQELDETLKIYERSRKEIIDQNLRNSFFDSEQGIYELATEFALTVRHEPRRAFEYAEASRSRSLLDLLQQEPRLKQTNGALDLQLTAFAEPLPINEIERRLPESVQLLQYAILHDRIVIWALTRNKSHPPAERLISSAELQRKVREFRQTVANKPNGREAGYEAVGKELYDLLIAPVAHLLNPNKRLCVVPDGALNELPFEALVSRQTGRFLADEFAVTRAPSASLFVLGYDSQNAQPTGKTLVAAAEEFDKKRFPDLDALPQTGREAKSIAAMRPGSVLLLNAKAEKSRILREMPSAEIIHLATHGQADLIQPLRSGLVFPVELPGTSVHSPEDDFLRAYEIYSLRLPNTRLVVLSACESGFGQNFRGEGMISLARAFLAAGVPTVIAGLWQAEAAPTSELMIRFHQQLNSACLTGDEALRRAQRQLREGGSGEYRHPYFWAAFTCVGS